ncbi:MAG: sulfur oxidation c-type cytochrome SoxA [Hyphomicrobiaceae bacterium]
MHRLWIGLLALLLSVHFADAEPRTSARAFLPPELQAQQADDGANPGMLWVEGGVKLWSKTDGSTAKSCAACHADPTTAMRGVAARYPAIDAGSGTLFNLEARINNCRVTKMGAAPFKYESDELLGLTALISYQSRGLPFSVRIEGPSTSHFEAGKAFFFEKQGQLNVACNQCHDDNVGKRLRGDRISSGLSTAYPAYRLDWQKMGSLHRRLRACSLGVRAEQLEFGSSAYVDLELYLAARAESAEIETPGVRK